MGAGGGVSEPAPASTSWGLPGFAGLLGVAQRDITPPDGIFMRCWGPATRDTAAGVHRPLTLTALAALAPSLDPLVLVAADLGWWQRIEDEQRVRRGLLDALGLPEERVLFTLSHTHAGPGLCTDDAARPGGELIGPYLDAIRDAAVSAAREAIAGAVPGTLVWATGSCDLAANRDLPVGERYFVGFNPAGEADSTLLVGRACADGGRVLGTLVNYACHPTTLAWQNELISPDWVGAMREVVEGATAAPCLFLQGASGELAPREQYVGDTAVADRHGARVGHAAVSTLLGMPPPGAELRFAGTIESGAPLADWRPEPAGLDGTLRAVRVEVPVELKALPTREELIRRWQNVGERSLEERLLRASRVRAIYEHTPEPVQPLWVWRLGSAVVVAQPGEAYSRLQTGLRARHPELAVAVLNVTNGPGWVYLPPRDAYSGDRYTAWQTPLAAGCLERLEAACDTAIAELTA
jgi:hypothetical protein